jgi:hypothetical protein
MADWRQQADRLHAAGYLQQFSNMAMNMCVPFWWSSGPRGGAQVRQNGTLCYVNTGTRRIGITADHVYAGYLVDKAQHEEVECQFGGSTVNPEDRLIARSERYDLATFDVPEVFVSASFRTSTTTTPCSGRRTRFRLARSLYMEASLRSFGILGPTRLIFRFSGSRRG